MMELKKKTKEKRVWRQIWTLSKTWRLIGSEKCLKISFKSEFCKYLLLLLLTMIKVSEFTVHANDSGDPSRSER